MYRYFIESYKGKVSVASDSLQAEKFGMFLILSLYYFLSLNLLYEIIIFLNIVDWKTGENNEQ